MLPAEDNETEEDQEQNTSEKLTLH